MSITLLLALLIPAQAVPAAPASTADIASAKPVADSNRLICKRYADLGSNIARRKRCLTKAQWDMMSRDAQQLKRQTEQPWTTPNQ